MTAPLPGKLDAAARVAGRGHRALHEPSMLPHDDDQELWLISYADMMTLLFSVFVIVVAIVGLAPRTPQSATADVVPANVTTPMPSTWDMLLAARANDAEVEPSPAAVLAPGQVVVDGPEAVRGRWLDYLQRLGLDKAVEVNVVDSKIDLIVRDRIMFASGRAVLQRDGASVLQRLSVLLDQVPGSVTVEGHTDSTPVHGGPFASNWDLSGARAAAVVQALVDFGLPPNRLRIVGYGETRPVADNATSEGRAANRRVVFVVEP